VIHLTQQELDTFKFKAAEADRLTKVAANLQQRLDEAVAALIECRKVHHADCLLGIQIRAAIDMARCGHKPNRALTEWAAQDAAIVGQLLQTEPS